MGSDQIRRFDPDLKYVSSYVGSGRYVPVMTEIPGGDYVLADDYDDLGDDLNARIRGLESDRDRLILERDAALAQLRDSDRMCRDTNAINASLTSALVGALKEWGVHVKMLDAVRGLIESNGCDCDCGCDSEGHADSCEPCLACRVSAEVSR